MRDHGTYDVVVVGAGIAGCTAATLYGRAGLRVGLLEAHRDPAAYKRMCTHYLQPPSVPVLERLGVCAELEEAGAVPNPARTRTPYGWMVDPMLMRDPRPKSGYNVLREVLDPVLRRAAAATPGVELHLGDAVDEVLREHGRVVGVVARSSDGTRHALRARLVVAADGRHSKTAKLAQVPEKTSPHGRFSYMAYYRDVQLAHPGVSQGWQDGKAVNYLFPNGDVTVLAAMRGKEELEAWRADPERHLLDGFAALDQAPDLSRATRVGDVTGVVNYPSVTRRATVPGLALVGDAGLVADYLWGVGCGWALESAQALVDATAGLLGDGAGVDRGLRRYARWRKRSLEPHQKLIADFATGRPYNGLERLLFAAAVHDDVVADRMFAFAARAIPPTKLLSPAFLLRALRARRRAEGSVTIPVQLAPLPEQERTQA